MGNTVWVIMWCDDGDYTSLNQCEVYADEDEAKEAFLVIVDELMDFHNVDSIGDLDEYIEFTSVTHGGDHVDMVEKEVQ